MKTLIYTLSGFFLISSFAIAGEIAHPGLEPIPVEREPQRVTGTLYSLRNVKAKLVAEGSLPRNAQVGECPFMAAAYLPNFGFKKTKSNLKTAKTGEVCVFKGGQPICGPHNYPVGLIAIKTEEGWWDGLPHETMNRPGFSLVACFAKAP